MRSCEKAGKVLAPVVHGALLFLQCNDLPYQCRNRTVFLMKESLGSFVTAEQQEATKMALPSLFLLIKNGGGGEGEKEKPHHLPGASMQLLWQRYIWVRTINDHHGNKCLTCHFQKLVAFGLESSHHEERGGAFLSLGNRNTFSKYLMQKKKCF